jgi:hypothetical protein
LDEDLLVTLADVHGNTWTRLEHLVALLVDSVGHSNYLLEMQMAVHTKNPQATARKIKRPEPIARPGVEKRKPRGTSLGQLARLKDGPR